MTDPNFERWVIDWRDEILQVQEFTKSDMPTNPAEIQVDLNRTTREYPRMAELLADADSHLIRLRAMETIDVKSDPKYKDWPAPERKAIIESKLIDAIHLRDILQATCRALQERHFALLNGRRYAEAELRMAGKGE